MTENGLTRPFFPTSGFPRELLGFLYSSLISRNQMSGGISKKTPLWLARKRRGLKQKQLAHLLNQRTVNQISRYERGTRLPTLQTALELEIALGVSVRDLFVDLYNQLEIEILERAKLDHNLKNTLLAKSGSGGCSFLDLFVSHIPPNEKIDQIRAHAIELTTKLNDLISMQHPQLE